MKKETIAKTKFTEIVSRPEEAIDMTMACLYIALEEYPRLQMDTYTQMLDDMAEDIRSMIQGVTAPRTILNNISYYLFEIEGFRGNSDNYYDPRNCYLNEVLDRKLGIPITLSILYIEVARRLGLPVFGVGLPGHYIVKYEDQEHEIFIDPFNEGKEMSRQDCMEKVEQMYGDHVPFQEEFLAAQEKRLILTRVLNNLKGIHLDTQNHKKALRVVDLLLILDPWAVNEIRDRATLNYLVKDYGSALHDFEKYLSVAPPEEDTKVVEDNITKLRTIIAQMN